MLYLLDTADLEFIKKAVDLYPVAGVTTNPTIIAREKKAFKPLLRSIREIIGPDAMLHAQAVSLSCDDIVKEAKYIYEIVGGDFYIKIPVIPQGIKAMKKLRDTDIKVTATAVFTAQQALMAAEAGADFVAPYVNRIDNIMGDGVDVVEQIAKLFEINNVDTKIIAASFKNLEQVHKVMLAGSHAVTVGKDLFEGLVYHPLTDISVKGFINDWEKLYGIGKTTLDVE